MIKKHGIKSNSSGESATKIRSIKSNGKATEKTVAYLLRQAYATQVEILRLPDKYDTGRHEDTRPSDFVVILNPNDRGLVGVSNTFYVEAKETGADKNTWSLLSTFRNGQLQAMIRANKLSIPYFVVFHYLHNKKIYLVPSTVILDLYMNGKKSIPKDVITQYPWDDGRLYNYFRK